MQIWNIWGKKYQHPKTLRLKTPSKKGYMPVINPNEVVNNVNNGVSLMRTYIQNAIDYIGDPQTQPNDKTLDTLIESLHTRLRYINEHGDRISEETLKTLLAEIKKDEQKIKIIDDKRFVLDMTKMVSEAVVEISRLLQ